MGMDGKVPDPSVPIYLSLYCYECGLPVRLANPIDGHANCLDFEGRMSVCKETSNYEPR